MRRSSPWGAVVTALVLCFLASCANPPARPLQTHDGAGSSGQLEIRLFAVNDLSSFRKKWQRSDHVPDEQSVSVVIQGGTVHLPILFKGCGVEDEGTCEIYGRLTISDVKTEDVVYRGSRVKLWTNQEAAAPGMWSMATYVPNVTVREGGNPMRIEFEVADDVWRETAHAGLILTTTGTVNEAKR